MFPSLGVVCVGGRGTSHQCEFLCYLRFYAVYNLLSTTCYLLSAIYYLLSTIDCLVSTIYYACV